MIVVSDTSPLAYLVAIGCADVLPVLYGEVVVPPAVARELQHDGSPAQQWLSSPPSWLRIVMPRQLTEDLDLDDGELEAIALALELGASRLLIDERRGRQKAQSLGLRVAGTLAVLIDASEQGLLNGTSALARLEKTSFHATAELLNAVRTKLERIQRGQ